MDGDRFDGISRRLAVGISRREVLRKIAGGAIGGSLAVAGLRRAGAATKVGVCHQTGSASNPFNYIEVSENAVPAHAAHGDATYVDLSSDVFNCGACGNVCGGDACNTPVCQAGVCGTVDVVCDDGNACTADSCDPVLGCQYAVITCDDGDLCTTDSCNPATGCVYTEITYTPNACEVDCICDSATGTFSCGARNCDDSNACTADSCDPDSGCVNTPIPYTPNACEVNCVCDPATGDVSCDARVCDDETACTTDTCDPELGCQHTPVDCSGVANECNDGICNSATGGCDRVPANEDEDCTTDDGEAGSCMAGACVAPTCGDVSGVVSDASTGDGISGATVSIGAQSTTTNGTGNYTLLCVPIGPQTVNASATGYVSETTPANVPPGGTVTANLALTPESSASEIFLKLSWNAQPLDLDSHLSGPDIEHGGRFHVAYYNEDPVSYASLDVDDIDGNGPETVTVIRTSGGTGNFVPGDYHYWVHNYSRSPEFDVSNAVVTITKDAAQIAQFVIGDAVGNPFNDLWWVVNFTLAADGTIALAPIQTLQGGDEFTVL